MREDVMREEVKCEAILGVLVLRRIMDAAVGKVDNFCLRMSIRDALVVNQPFLRSCFVNRTRMNTDNHGQNIKISVCLRPSASYFYSLLACLPTGRRVCQQAGVQSLMVTVSRINLERRKFRKNGYAQIKKIKSKKICENLHLQQRRYSCLMLPASCGLRGARFRPRSWSRDPRGKPGSCWQSRGRARGFAAPGYFASG